MIWTILLLLLGLVLLYYGAEFLVRGSASLSLRLGVSPLLVGLTVVAFCTSAPELFVSLKAASLGQGDISVGNVVGSNICNIGLILGLSALIVPIRVASQIVRVDTPLMIGATLLAIGFVLDGRVTRIEGIILFLLFVAYLVFSIVLAKKKAGDVLAEEFSDEVKVSKGGVFLDLLFILGGLGILILGARLLVTSAIDIARALGMSEAVIGLTVVAVGTSLPELATSVVAAMKKEADIAVGNVVGSNLFNILSILGLSATIIPLDAGGITRIDLAVMLLFALVLWWFAWSGSRVTRIEGGILLAGYLAYCVWLVAGA